jgi:DNA modification methylase
MIRASHEYLEHPTQKPIALMRWCIGQPWTPDGTIIDPYMGSGSTLVAAKAMERSAIGIEIEERYCEIAAKRLSQEMLPFTELMGTAMRDADAAAEQYLIDLEAK